MAPVWFISAASSGFGREIALVALKRGHTVIATARNPQRIQDLADAGAKTLAFDVTWPLEKIQELADKVFAEHGRIDYLINAAGFILEAAVEEASPQEVLDCFNTNVFGVVNTLKAFLPGMRAQPLATGNGNGDGNGNAVRGTVANFSSLGSWEGGASFSIYAMTKVCMASLAESLQPELEPFAIRSTTIEPGYFRTSFLNSGARMLSKQRIDAYDDENTPSGKMRRMLDVVDGKQPGDVKKGSEVAVDALTGTGSCEGKELPLRIVLGSDCEKTIRRKCDGTIALLDDWKDIVRSTDYPEGQ